MPSEVFKCGTGVGLKAVWYGSEIFGNVIGLFQNISKPGKSTAALDKMTKAAVVESIRADYDENYFINGQV